MIIKIKMGSILDLTDFFGQTLDIIVCESIISFPFPSKFANFSDFIFETVFSKIFYLSLFKFIIIFITNYTIYVTMR